jgi:hypothetical protein
MAFSAFIGFRSGRTTYGFDLALPGESKVAHEEGKI